MSRRRPLFDDLAMLHHHDVVADLRRNTQIVSDEQNRDAETLLHLVQQIEHLRLHRDVESGHRLVGHQHVRVHRQRTRNGDPLPLSAGELMRITRHGIGRQIDQLQQLACPLQRIFARRSEIDRAFSNGFTNRDARIERAIRILEDHLDALAVRLQQAPRQERDFMSHQPDRARCRIDQPNDTARNGRFARAAFTRRCRAFVPCEASA